MQDDTSWLRVLMSAYACVPQGSSEPGMAWEVVRAMAPLHGLTVVTRSVYESSVAAEVARTGEELSSCLRLSSLDQWIGRGSQLRPVFVMALRMVSILRMQAVRAVFTAAPALRRVMAGPGVYLVTSPATADALRSLGAVDVRLASDVNVSADSLLPPRAVLTRRQGPRWWSAPVG